MRILMVTHSFFPENIGGAEYQTKVLSEELVRRGHEVLLVAPPGGSQHVDNLENLRYHPQPFTGWKNKMKAIRSIRSIIKSEDIDIIHSHFAYPAGFLTELALIGKSAPHVITSHGADLFKIPEVGGYRFDRKKEYFIRWTLKRCDRHIMISDAMKEHAVEAGSSESKMVKILNPAPPVEDVPEEESKELIRDFGLEDETYILTMCRHVPQKGLSYLIKAFNRLADDYPELQLVIGSDGEKREELEELVETLGLSDRVIFTGFVSEKEKLALTKHCDVFCLPSLMEGLPLGLFEAMNYERPIVATNVGGTPEVVRDGEEAILVPPKDSEKLSQAIETALDKRNSKNLGHQAKERLCSRFKLEDVADKHIKLYRKILRWSS